MTHIFFPNSHHLSPSSSLFLRPEKGFFSESLVEVYFSVPLLLLHKYVQRKDSRDSIAQHTQHGMVDTTYYVYYLLPPLSLSLPPFPHWHASMSHSSRRLSERVVGALSRLWAVIICNALDDILIQFSLNLKFTLSLFLGKVVLVRANGSLSKYAACCICACKKVLLFSPVRKYSCISQYTIRTARSPVVK